MFGLLGYVGPEVMLNSWLGLLGWLPEQGCRMISVVARLLRWVGLGVTLSSWAGLEIFSLFSWFSRMGSKVSIAH